MSLPEGWTDDMSIALPAELTIDDVVDVVFNGEAMRAPYEATVARLLELGISAEDAALAYDRALGGVVRAATTNPANEPDKSKDPIAWASYQRCRAAPNLIATVQPELAERMRPAVASEPARRKGKPRWSFWR